MTEKELSELYTRLALQFDSMLGTLVSKNPAGSDFVPDNHAKPLGEKDTSDRDDSKARQR